MIPRRTTRVPWSESRWQVRTDRPRWRQLLSVLAGPCNCFTHRPEECTATWRCHLDA